MVFFIAVAWYRLNISSRFIRPSMLSPLVLMTRFFHHCGQSSYEHGKSILGVISLIKIQVKGASDGDCTLSGEP